MSRDRPVELQQDDERVLAGEEDVHVRNYSKSARKTTKSTLVETN